MNKKKKIQAEAKGSPREQISEVIQGQKPKIKYKNKKKTSCLSSANISPIQARQH